ncbi:MAG: HIRAN domain-containing protein [Ruminiclostridium sp.]|nr:HIRAN domain-containing protein [Ruminiclostridium sp.]
MKSKVMTIANALVKQGMSRSAAMIRAWITVKLRTLITKTAGVTYGRRQGLLDRLNRYSPDDITITLQRENGNAYDPNAVQIVAAVRGKGSAIMGYIGRELAKVIAPLLDKGKPVKAAFAGITGGHEYGLNYGMNVAISL